MAYKVSTFLLVKFILRRLISEKSLINEKNQSLFSVSLRSLALFQLSVGYVLEILNQFRIFFLKLKGYGQSFFFQARFTIQENTISHYPTRGKMFLVVEKKNSLI